MSVALLLARLDRAGVQVILEPDGHTLALSAVQEPPAALLAELKACKPALIAHLSRIDPTRLGQQVGHCGSCAHWTSDGFGDYLGICGLGWAAHGLPHQPGPVLITVHATCMAMGGTAWSARKGSERP